MFAAILIFLPLLTKAVTFKPENAGLLSNGLTSLPILYNLTGSQTKFPANSSEAPGSFWSASFIHASDSHDYLVLSHTGLGGYQASVLDITDPSQYDRFTVLSNVSNLYADNGDFNASFPDYGFGSIAPKDGNLAMRTWSSVSGVEFDLSFELSSPVLLNGGLGSFQTGSSAVNEWSMPAGKTTGWLSRNGTKVTVNTQKSLTWYDRQWNGAPPSWTWFALIIDSGKAGEDITPMSIWSYNTTSGLEGLATIREAAGVQNVLPVASIQSSNRSYTSETSGVMYPLDWVLELSDGTTLYISSVRPDQELSAAGAVAPAYEGYVTVKGAYKSGRKFKGYGVVEMTASSPA